MICDYCTVEFEIPNKGSGGKNRLFCFSCLPNGLSRQERNKTRNNLYSKRMREHKESIGCFSCGYKLYGGALEWHHHEDNKNDNVADIIHKSWGSYLVEVSKCILLCSCCHKEVHAGVRKV